MNNDDVQFAVKGSGFKLLLFLGCLGQEYELEFEQFRMVDAATFSVYARGTARRKQSEAEENDDEQT